MNDRVQAAIDRVVSGEVFAAVVHLGGNNDNFVQVANFGNGLRVEAGAGVSRDLAEELGMAKVEWSETYFNQRHAKNVEGAGRAIGSMLDHITDGTVRQLNVIDNDNNYADGSPYYF